MGSQLFYAGAFSFGIHLQRSLAIFKENFEKEQLKNQQRH